jgi:replicative DNA helicase
MKSPIINMERTILSSILFDEKQFNLVNNILEDNDFLSESHKNIYVCMMELFEENKPISEDFIHKKLNDKKIDGQLFDIISTLPITNILVYVKEIKKESIEREIKLLGNKLNNKFDIETIDKILLLRDKLFSLNSIKKLKNIDEIKDILNKYSLTAEELKKASFEYLIDNFIVKNEITMLAARPSSGKSLTTMGFVHMILNENKVIKVIYLDGDNSKTTLNERGLSVILEKYKEKINYIQGHKNIELQEIIKQILQTNLKDVLIVFDSIKNFMFGSDRDKNKDVSKIMELLKDLRNNGATIIFLHHTNKPKQDIDELIYAGSSAWEEDTTNAFILKINHDKKAFVFEPFKKRVGDLCELGFTYCQNTITMKLINLDEAKETNEDFEIRNEIIEFISNAKNEPNYTQILNYLMENGFPKMKCNSVINHGKNKYWETKKLKQFNKTVFYLKNSENNTSKVEIKFDSSHLKVS